MKIGDDHIPTVANLITPVEKSQQQDNSFAFMLESERLKAENEAARNDVLAHQKAKTETPHKDDIDYIRKYGMRAYAEEVHKQKLEELREKILEAMGLTEEALSEMPADLRLTIEKMVSEEIQKRVAADSVVNGGPESEGQPTHQEGVGGIDPENITVAQVVAGDPGSAIGLAISEAEHDLNLFGERLTDREDR